MIVRPRPDTRLLSAEQENARLEMLVARLMAHSIDMRHMTVRGCVRELFIII